MPTSPPLARALAERNYDKLTPVQTAVLANEAAGRDLLVSAQTGSGKTVAYGLAIANELLGGAERFERAAAPLALIVAPTRELALQVHRELAWLYQYADARVVSCVGGMDPRREQRELAAGAHIVVGTPGRLCDHLRRNRLDISELKAVVLDEADEMLDLGFREDMEFILETTPETRRTLLFSATLPRVIVALAKEYQQEAFRIEVGGDEGGHADIDYRAIRIAPGAVDHADVASEPEGMQHRAGRVARAVRKGGSVLLVPAARRRRAEVLLNRAGMDAIWRTPQQDDEIGKLDHERMLKDALFAEETTADD